MLALFASVLSLALGAVAAPAPEPAANRVSYMQKEGVKYTVFDHAATGASLQYVTNSGICETTPGVNQYSGYLTVGTNMNMFFWFFEARNSSATAPLAVWLNGGPGCSSMIGLFQENGPCRFLKGQTTPSLNPYSFNNNANMLYIDQPIGTGFSYGTADVNSSDMAATYVWKLLQAFYTQFPQYKSREFGIWTESYGGHYGPALAKHLLKQNAGIDNKTVTGEKVNLVALGMNNGWFDAELQYKSYIDYSFNNSYKALITSAQRSTMLTAYTNRCLPTIKSCLSSGNNAQCETSARSCDAYVQSPLLNMGNFDVYDIREPYNSPNPPSTYIDYLLKSDVRKAIGASVDYTECSNAAHSKFLPTGDHTRSYVEVIGDLVKSGLRTLIWAGDADWICNWLGNLNVADVIDYPGRATFAAKKLEPYTVKGKQGGTVKTEGALSFLRVFNAGHEVMYYQPELSLQVFEQTMQKQAPKST